MRLSMIARDGTRAAPAVRGHPRTRYSESVPSDAGALLPYLHAVVARRHLTPEESLAAMRVILCGDATAAQIAAFLTALHMKGETASELAGFARAMREAALPVPFETPPGEVLLDTCGTGATDSTPSTSRPPWLSW